MWIFDLPFTEKVLQNCLFADYMMIVGTPCIFLGTPSFISVCFIRSSTSIPSHAYRSFYLANPTGGFVS